MEKALEHQPSQGMIPTSLWGGGKRWESSSYPCALLPVGSWKSWEADGALGEQTERESSGHSRDSSGVTPELPALGLEPPWKNSKTSRPGVTPEIPFSPKNNTKKKIYIHSS